VTVNGVTGTALDVARGKEQLDGKSLAGVYKAKNRNRCWAM
jgi:hypothetical protein